MKKYLVIGLLIAFAGAMILIPYFKNQESTEEEKLPAMFTFKENLAAKWGDKFPINIQVTSSQIEKLELVYNDSLLKKWSQPKGILQFPFDIGLYGVGTKMIQLISTMKDGSTIIDERMVRVLSDVIPEKWLVREINSYPHLETSFTQGLEFDGGKLFEGTGQKGQSLIALVDLKTGRQLQKMGLDASYFGEGITIFNDEIYHYNIST